MGDERPASGSLIAESSRSWSAEWVWSPAETAAPNSFYYFRQEFEADADEVTVHVTADTHYRLFVDGERAGRGPPDGLPFHKYYDTHRVALDDRDGPHCIGVLVNYHDRMAGTRGGLLLEVDADGATTGDAEAGATLAATDDTWRVTGPDAWRRDTHYYRPNRHFPYQEWRDLRRVPEGWSEAGFDDAGWTSRSTSFATGGAGVWSTGGFRPRRRSGR